MKRISNPCSWPSPRLRDLQLESCCKRGLPAATNSICCCSGDGLRSTSIDMLLAHCCRYKPADIAADDWDTAIYGALARARELRRLCQGMQDSADQVFLSQIADSIAQQGRSQFASRKLPPAPASAAAAAFIKSNGLLSIWSPVHRAGRSAHDAAAEMVDMLQSLMWL